MNNRFWGAWKAGEANTLTEWLGKCLKGDFDFLLPFLGLSCVGFSLHTPLNPVSHRGTGQRVEWVVLGAKVHAKTSPYTSRCLLVWLLPCKYYSSTPACWEGVRCRTSRIGIVGRAFHPVVACWINGADLCACACLLLSLLYFPSYCNGCGV